MKSSIISLLFICCLMLGTAFGFEDAIILGENVRVRKSPNLSSKILVLLQVGTLVDLLDVTDEREKLDEDEMYGYHWFKVSTQNGVKGWVYGEFIYLNSEDVLPPDWITEEEYPLVGGVVFIDEHAEDERILKEIELEGKRYKFDYAIETCYPPFDNGGPTGASLHGLPFLYDVDADKTLPLIAFDEGPKRLKGLDRVEFLCDRDDAWFTDDGGCWFRVVYDEGETSRFTDLEIKSTEEFGDLAVLSVSFNTQLGGGEYYLALFPEDDYTVIECFYYKEHIDGDVIEKGTNLLE